MEQILLLLAAFVIGALIAWRLQTFFDQRRLPTQDANLTQLKEEFDELKRSAEGKLKSLDDKLKATIQNNKQLEDFARNQNAQLKEFNDTLFTMVGESNIQQPRDEKNVP